jgi:DNA-directed RNA polymerase specialized sigma24 family protein
MSAADPNAGDVSPAAGPISSEEAYAAYYSESFERHVAWTLKEFKSLVRDRHTAEQIVSDAFYELYGDRATIHSNPDAAVIVRIRKYATTFRDKRTVSADDSSVERLDKKIDPVARPADSEYASQECRDLFGAQVVAVLEASERRVYDLFVSGKTIVQIAESHGIPYEEARERLREITTKLFAAMARLVTLGNTSVDNGRLRTPKAAEEAMDRLPHRLSTIVRLTYVDKLTPAQIAHQLKISSAQQVSSDLERALDALSQIYRVKMPDALVAALAYKYAPRSGVKKTDPEA